MSSPFGQQGSQDLITMIIDLLSNSATGKPTGEFPADQASNFYALQQRQRYESQNFALGARDVSKSAQDLTNTINNLTSVLRPLQPILEGLGIDIKPDQKTLAAIISSSTPYLYGGLQQVGPYLGLSPTTIDQLWHTMAGPQGSSWLLANSLSAQLNTLPVKNVFDNLANDPYYRSGWIEDSETMFDRFAQEGRIKVSRKDATFIGQYLQRAGEMPTASFKELENNRSADLGKNIQAYIDSIFGKDEAAMDTAINQLTLTYNSKSSSYLTKEAMKEKLEKIRTVNDLAEITDPVLQDVVDKSGLGSFAAGKINSQRFAEQIQDLKDSIAPYQNFLYREKGYTLDDEQVINRVASLNGGSWSISSSENLKESLERAWRIEEINRLYGRNEQELGTLRTIMSASESDITKNSLLTAEAVQASGIITGTQTWQAKLQYGEKTAGNIANENTARLAKVPGTQRSVYLGRILQVLSSEELNQLFNADRTGINPNIQNVIDQGGMLGTFARHVQTLSEGGFISEGEAANALYAKTGSRQLADITSPAAQRQAMAALAQVPGIEQMANRNDLLHNIRSDALAQNATQEEADRLIGMLESLNQPENEGLREAVARQNTFDLTGLSEQDAAKWRDIRNRLNIQNYDYASFGMLTTGHFRETLRQFEQFNQPRKDPTLSIEGQKQHWILDAAEGYGNLEYTMQQMNRDSWNGDESELRILIDSMHKKAGAYDEFATYQKEEAKRNFEQYVKIRGSNTHALRLFRQDIDPRNFRYRNNVDQDTFRQFVRDNPSQALSDQLMGDDLFDIESIKRQAYINTNGPEFESDEFESLSIKPQEERGSILNILTNKFNEVIQKVQEFFPGGGGGGTEQRSVESMEIHTQSVILNTNNVQVNTKPETAYRVPVNYNV